MFKSLFSVTLVVAAASLTRAQEVEWQKVVAPDSSFSFEMPGKVTLDSVFHMAGSKPVTTYYYTSSLATASFAVGYTDLSYLKGTQVPDSQVETLLDGELSNVIGGLENSEVIYNLDAVLDGNKGKRIQATGTNGATPVVFNARNYLVGLRFYEIMTQSVIGAVSADDFKRFFDSFTLLKTK